MVNKLYTMRIKKQGSKFHRNPPKIVFLALLCIVALCNMLLLFQFDKCNSDDKCNRDEVSISINNEAMKACRMLASTLKPKDSARRQLVDFTYGTILTGRVPARSYQALEDSLKFETAKKKDTSVKDIRVCLFTNEFGGIAPSGGIGYVVEELASLLASNGASVTVAYLGGGKAGDDLIGRLAAKGITFFEVPPAHEPIPIAPGHPTLLHSYRALRHLIKVDSTKEAYDIVHFNDYLGHGLFSLYAKNQGWLLTNTKVVVTLHGVTSWARIANKQLPSSVDDLTQDWCETKAVSLADYVWAPSKFIASFLVSRGITLPAERLFVMRNAPPSLEFKKQPFAQKGDSGGIKEIIFFARLEERKGPFLLVEALDLLSKRNPGILDNIVISFLGRDTPIDDNKPSVKMKILEQFKSEQSLQNVEIKFLENCSRNEALNYIRSKNSLVVIPSLTENLPGTVFESIEVGAAFIAADVGGIPELLHPEDRDRCLFRPLPGSLADKILERMRDVSKNRPARHSKTPAEIRLEILSFHSRISSEGKTHSKYVASSLSSLRAKDAAPKITVCITHYERPEVLIDTLKLWRLQTYPNFEIIVVDDESPSQKTQEMLDEEVTPFLRENGWRLVKAKHGYLGATRNRCVEAASSDTEWFFMNDEDDFVRPDALQVLLDAALYTNADVITAFVHCFKAETLTEAVKSKSESIWMFPGGSVAMGIAYNSLGANLMLVSAQAFHSVGGYTEFNMVGCEDYEFYMKAITTGLHYEVVPIDLFFVQKKSESMSTSMDISLSDFRAISPVFQAYPQLADGLMLLKGLLYKHKVGAGAVVVVSSDTFGDQGELGWEYGFCCHQHQRITIHECFFEEFLEKDVQEARYHMESRSKSSWPYVGRYGMHTFVGDLNGVAQSVTAVRRFKSFISGRVNLKLMTEMRNPCGDGVYGALYNGEELLWSHQIVPGMPPHLWTDTTELSVGQHVTFMLSPNENDTCDSVTVLLQLIPSKSFD